MNEFELIARYFAPLAAGTPGALGLTDDAAVLKVAGGCGLVVTTDTLVSGVHFLPDDPPETIAAKLLGVNLSDLAAMGARPLAYTMSMALPTAQRDDERCRWLDGFVRGLSARQAEAELYLIGGDTVATPGPLCLTITALGTVVPGTELRRSGARAGDAIYVSGTIGDATLGLRALAGTLPPLSEALRATLITRYRVPEPRLALGQRLVGVAHAAADVSDGLVADLGHICDASGLSATLWVTRTPLSAAAAEAVRAEPELLRSVLTGGDDYELVFTASADAAPSIAAIAGELGVRLTEIGRMDPAPAADRTARVRIVDPGGAPVDLGPGGFRHF
ncbi:MAG: thiamine-phosphate kinase [Rhodospirillales bacterium]